MSEPQIEKIDAYRVKIPLRTPYHLSKVYGTLTHCDVVLVCVAGAGVQGWGEADPGGLAFSGDTAESVMDDIRGGIAASLIGRPLHDWISPEGRPSLSGAVSAAFDVAAHDAIARLNKQPVWQLLGDKLRDQVEVLWPTSSGSADDDLQIINTRFPEGFRTYMLKMGDKPIAHELARVSQVLDQMPSGVKIMVDANQGWQREEAIAFARGAADMPLVLMEQPVAASDLAGMHAVREVATVPVSVDESLQQPTDADKVIGAAAADVFSIKVSKNGGLQASLGIARQAADNGINLLMNSMIELGITQSASLHLACVLPNLLDCGHAYMSTLRMADDVTDFSEWIVKGRALLPDKPGLGVNVDMNKISAYLQDEFHVGSY